MARQLGLQYRELCDVMEKKGLSLQNNYKPMFGARKEDAEQKEAPGWGASF
jgi:hypothetical protein